MIISKPNDGLGLLYHVVDLLGQTVHAYRDASAALRIREGDQRVFIQDETTKQWLTGKPYPADSPAPRAETARIPEATLRNFDTLRLACRSGHLALVSSALQESGEPVALLCAVGNDNDAYVLTPFGHMVPDGEALVDSERRLTQVAADAFDRLRHALSSDHYHAWFGVDEHGHTTIGLCPLGVTPQPGWPHQAVLAWDNPFELYTPPEASGDGRRRRRQRLPS